MPNWKPVSGGDFHDWSAEPVLVGVFTSKEEGVPTANGLRSIYHFTLEDGSQAKSWETAALNTKLHPGLQGHLVKITRGEKASTAAGRSMWQFEVMDGGPAELPTNGSSSDPF